MEILYMYSPLILLVVLVSFLWVALIQERNENLKKAEEKKARRKRKKEEARLLRFNIKH